jgi:hypothetical protein
MVDTDKTNRRPMIYWRLWLFDAVLVGAGVLFFLATRYGTREFFGRSVAMASLPFIAVMILVGGAGSTIFALTKVLIEKRGWKPPAALALLAGPALLVTLPLVLLGAIQSPAHQLSYICAGNAPAAASQVRLAGYSTFLREEWLAVFHVDEKSFQTMAARSKLVPVDGFAFKMLIGRSDLKKTGLYQSLPPLNEALCYQRVFNESQEHELGSVCAVFDPATSTAAVYRGYVE